MDGVWDRLHLCFDEILFFARCLGGFMLQTLTWLKERVLWMECTLAFFPWGDPLFTGSWRSLVCVCVSPRFVSPPGHLGHAPFLPLPSPPSCPNTSVGRRGWRIGDKESDSSHSSWFRFPREEPSLGRTNRHTPRGRYT